MRLDHLLSRENMWCVSMGVWCLVWLLGVPHNKLWNLCPCLLVIMMVAGGGVVLCENCIVDAKSFFCLISCVVLCVFFVWRTTG